jgi:hypothetical protein
LIGKKCNSNNLKQKMTSLKTIWKDIGCSHEMQSQGSHQAINLGTLKCCLLLKKKSYLSKMQKFREGKALNFSSLNFKIV